MNRSLLFLFVALTVLAVSGTSALGQAGVCNTCGPVPANGFSYGQGAVSAMPMSHWDQCLLDCKRNNVWPQPFVTQDRHAVCSSYSVFARSGWSRQNTLSEFHFDPVTNQLTEAGKLKVRQILLHHPAGRIDIFMARSMNEEHDRVRLTSVEHEGTRMLPDGKSPSVTPVDIEYRMRPAEEVDFITRSRMESMPAPQLPDSQ